MMNMRQAMVMCSSLPILGCVMGTLLHLFFSYESTSSSATIMVEDDEENDGAAANNRGAQKHFQQIQCIRGA